MLERVPTAEKMTSLIGEHLYNVWQQLIATIDEKYDMDCSWNSGGKKWTYEYKYRRGGKTLCALYVKENCVGFMVIFGKNERDALEAQREHYSQSILQTYDEAATYHDGKWVMFEPTDTSEFEDYLKLLAIKRKPNKK